MDFRDPTGRGAGLGKSRDRGQQAHSNEEEIRNKVKAAKKRYEDALREKFFGF
jgi:hypothetical protein